MLLCVLRVKVLLSCLSIAVLPCSQVQHRRSQSRRNRLRLGKAVISTARLLSIPTVLASLHRRSPRAEPVAARLHRRQRLCQLHL